LSNSVSNRLIFQVQGKDPSVDITQDMPDDGEDDEDDVSSGRADDGMEGLQHQSTSPYSLPQCELSELDDIAECFSFSMRTQVGREQLSRSLEENNYIPKLLELFRQCEDLEDLPNLHKLFEIIKVVFLLNKTSVFEVLIQEENIMSVIGCLEYDPTLQQPRKHRQYLMAGVKFKEVLPISNVELRKKIHQTFRLQYIQDVVLPTPSVFDENMLSTLASVIFFNKVEIVNLVQEDQQLLPNLFKDMSDENIDDKRRCELAGFLRELLCLAQTLQPPAKEDFFKNLSKLGILNGIEQLFSCDDRQAHRIAVDIFQHVVENNPSMVRDFANQEMNRDSSENGDEALYLVNMLIEQMICDPDPELSAAMQLNGLLRILLDPENMVAKNNEKTEFLGFFYRHCMHVLMAPVLANTADEMGPSKDDYQTANLLSIILDIITFSVEHHTYHVKNYILTKDLLRRVLVLLKSRYKFLCLAALRFMRRIVSKQDEFYNRYIIKGDLFKPVVDELFLSGRRYNLINSAILEMFEFINTEKVKSLITYIIQQHYNRLETIDYVQTFVKLKNSFDQQQDRQLNSSLASSGTEDDSSSVSLCTRFARDVGSMDEQEESWFDRDGSESPVDDDTTGILGLDVADDEDSFEVAPRINIGSILDDQRSSSDFCERSNGGGLQEKLKIEINIPSVVKGVNGVESKPTTVVKNGLVGLVDYSDDSDDEDSPKTEESTDDVIMRSEEVTKSDDDGSPVTKKPRVVVNAE